MLFEGRKVLGLVLSLNALDHWKNLGISEYDLQYDVDISKYRRSYYVSIRLGKYLRLLLTVKN